VRRFTLERVHNAGGVFSYDKLKWMNGVYIRKLSPEDLQARVTPFLEAAGFAVDGEKLRRIIPHIQPRLELLPDAAGLVDFLFRDRIDRDLPAMLKKGMDAERARRICLAAADQLESVPSFEPASIEAAIRGVSEQTGAGTGPAFTVVRIAVTGKKVTPPLFESLYALGREGSVARLRETANLLAGVTV
jgi:glutamyl-tRNA synthetase